MIITLIDKPIPVWVYPFIFYVQVSVTQLVILRFINVFYLCFQMAPYVSRYFPVSFERVGVYVSHSIYSYPDVTALTYFCIVTVQMMYANSASGFYFIYDFCLLSSLPPLASYFLRYIPFIIALIVCFSIRIIRYS